MSSATRYRLFVVVTPGLEPLLEDEVTRLLPDVAPTRAQGGLELIVSREQLWRLARGSRLAEALRVRVGRFEAHDFETLVNRLNRLPWHAYLPRNARPRVSVSTRKSALYHSGAVEERVQRVLAERLGTPDRGAGPDGSDQSASTVFVRLRRDAVTISIDASGDRLHKRGYREHVGKAPLRETLAAACLAEADLPADRPVWDPFCGSGTLVIEELSRRLGLLPGRGRHFGFESWPTHDAEAYSRWRNEQRDATPTTPGESGAVGSDRDPDELAAAAANALRAGVDGHIAFRQGDVADVAASLEGPHAIITNLPYGHRTRGGTDLTDTLGRFGEIVQRRADLAPVWALTTDDKLPGLTGQRWRERLRFSNRGLPVTLFELSRGDT